MKALSRQVEEQITRRINAQSLEVGQMANKVQLGIQNSRQAFNQINNHTSSLVTDVHNIKETILDVVNENLIKNAGFELMTDAAGSVVDDWILTNELLGQVFVEQDAERAKYGNQSLKFHGHIGVGSSGRAYVSQQVAGDFRQGEYYTFSFFYLDNHEPGYSHYALVEFLDSNNQVISGEEFDVMRHVDTGEYDNRFVRFSRYFTIPNEGVSSIRVSVGVGSQPAVGGQVGVWIDYIMLHRGTVAYQPGELISGIIKTDHLKSDIIDTRHLKAQIIEADHLKSDIVDTRHLKSDVIEAKHIKSDSIEAEHVRSGTIEAVVAEIDQAFIRSSHIENLNADKLYAGTIDTNRVTISSANNAIRISGDTLSIFDSENEVVTLGRTDGVNYGLIFSAGEIKLGRDASGSPLFYVNNAGEILAQKGHIANFVIDKDTITTLDNTLELDAISSSISLSNHPNYKTTIRPSGIFGTAPIAQISEFSSGLGANGYYVEIVKVYTDTQVFEKDIDYSFNRKTGEIIKRKAAAKKNMPDVVNVDYITYDSRDRESVEAYLALFGLELGLQGAVYEFTGELAEGANIEIKTEPVIFQVKERTSAIITDDALLDASFVTNLVVGAAEIALASIDTAHIRELHGKRIIGETIEAKHLTSDAIQTKFADITEAFIKSAHIQEIDVSKLKIGGQRTTNVYKTPSGTVIFDFNNSLMANNGTLAQVM